MIQKLYNKELGDIVSFYDISAFTRTTFCSIISLQIRTGIMRRIYNKGALSIFINVEYDHSHQQYIAKITQDDREC